MAPTTEEQFLAALWDGASLEGLEVRGADVSGVVAFDLAMRHCLFVDVDFSDLDWDGLRCSSSTFLNCRFTRASLEAASFDRCTFFDQEAETGCKFWNTRLRTASFTGCTLDGCSFEAADLYRVSIQQSRALGATFFKANCHGAVVFKNNLMSYADLRNADLRNCDLSGTDFKWALLDGADFGNANLMGCDLSHATLQAALLAGADLRGARVGSLDLRTLDVHGVKILESQLPELLERFELVIFPDNR